jgi:hypothetical protein
LTGDCALTAAGHKKENSKKDRNVSFGIAIVFYWVKVRCSGLKKGLKKDK